jgi:hypothetical protein
MLTNCDDGSIKVLLESHERSLSIFGVPNWRGGHAEYLRTLKGMGLEIFAHDAVISVIFSCMMAFIEDEKRNLSVRKRVQFRRIVGEYLIDAPVGMGEYVQKYLR